MRPKKHLGQNFLTSIPARLAIVKGGEIVSADTILEIGPGKGFLTKGLLDSGAKVIALEKDPELIPLLNETLKEYTNLTIVEGDALTYDPPNVPYKLIANIPYYITGAIFSYYLSHTHHPTHMVTLIQKEVAERIVAKDGKESLLSLSIKCYGEPRIIYRVSRGSFNPIPSVDSAVLQIKNITKDKFSNQYHEALFFKLIHAAFAHKRKFAVSNIQQVFKEPNIRELFMKNNLSEKVRAEDVTLSAWLSLSQQLSMHS